MRINWSSYVNVGNELEYVNDAVSSGWLSQGQYVLDFEASLNELYSSAHCFAVSNGTVALQLAYQLLGVKPGDKVIVPGFGFQAAGNVLKQLGAEPVFCDICPLTWNQTLDTVKKAVLVDGVVGVVVVHNYGRAAPSKEIAEWANAVGLWTIEDCAEAWFTSYLNNFVGLYGDVATFSMHATKTIAAGEGGVVMVKDAQLVERLKLLRSHGLSREHLHYFHELPGNNYRLSNVSAAIALAKMEKQGPIRESQEYRYKCYERGLLGIDGLIIQRGLRDAQDNVWAVAVELPLELLQISRDEFIIKLADMGIETRPGFYPPTSLNYYSDYSLTAIPVSERMSRRIIVLPCGPTLTPEEIEFICEAMRVVLQENKRFDEEIKFVSLKDEVDAENLLRDFLEFLGRGAHSFRYFSKRDLSVVRDHVTSIILQVAGRPIGYGHIEIESEVSWLGIAVAGDSVGNGWGSVIISKLLNSACDYGLREVDLKVDPDNSAAIRLYSKHGFEVVPALSCEGSLHMRISLAHA